MNIYLCGACRTGKAEIVRRMALETKGVEVRLDQSEEVFIPLFGHGLDRVFRRRPWEGKIEEACQGMMAYLESFRGSPDRTTVYNEGPLLILSHLLYFGALALATDQQREQILRECMDLMKQGEHYIIERWADNSTFDRVSVDIQKSLGCNRPNVFVIEAAEDYERTVEKALVQIRKGKVALQKKVAARIIEEKEIFSALAKDELAMMERLQDEARLREQAEWEKLQAERRQLEKAIADRQAEMELQFEQERKEIAEKLGEVVKDGTLDDAELQSAKA